MVSARVTAWRMLAGQSSVFGTATVGSTTVRRGGVKRRTPARARSGIRELNGACGRRSTPRKGGSSNLWAQDKISLVGVMLELPRMGFFTRAEEDGSTGVFSFVSPGAHPLIGPTEEETLIPVWPYRCASYS